MPKDTGYAPGPRSGVSSNRTAFPENREPKGTLRSGPPPRSERPVRQNVHNIDRLGRAQPWKGSR